MTDDVISRQAAIDGLCRGEGCGNICRRMLEHLPSAQPNVPDTNVGDMISRQAAIDTIMEEPSEVRYPVFYAEKIKQLPSAQPEPSQVARDIATIIENEKDMRVVERNAQQEIIRCKDCKWHDFGKPDMVYCQSLDCFVNEDFFCKNGERSVENGSTIVPPSWADKPDHS